MKSRALAVALLLLLACLFPAPCLAQSQAHPEGASGRGAPVLARAAHAMAATANPHATRAALEMLRAGGNAVDAAAAAALVLNVVEPQSSGIGGGGFLLLFLAKTGEVVALDGREEAPAAAAPGMFLGPDGKPVPFYPDRITGGRPVGVPGLLALLERAVRDHGRLPLARVLEPAIRLAAGGFPVSPRLAGLLARGGERLARFPATRAVLFGAGGKPLAEGDRLVQPALAATLRLIAREGAAVFYRGEVARDIVRAVREAPVNPGAMTLADLAGYRAVRREPAGADYRGYRVVGMGPPSSGGVTLLQMLQLLEAAPPLPGGASPALRVHRFVQAVRLAYADRGRYLADPDFVPVPVAGLLAPAYARQRAAAVQWGAPLAPVKAGRPPGVTARWGGHEGAEGPSTTHLTVVDADRNVAALTASIEQAFGSGMVVPGRGFLLNNQLTDFSPRPATAKGRPVANRVEGGRRPRLTALGAADTLGGKRPRSSMAPTLVLRGGKPVLALGSPGGPLIIQFVAEALLRVLDQGMPLHLALAAPHATHIRGATLVEPGFAGGGEGERLKSVLERLGHQVLVRELTSGLHAVWIDPASGDLLGAADPRREGVAEGF